MRKVFTTLTMFAVVCALAVTVMAQGNGNGNGNNGNGNGNTGNGQNNKDFEGTGVLSDGEVSVPETVIKGTPTFIVVTLNNADDRGMPDITLFLNGELIATWDSIAKYPGSVTYTIPVDTSVTGLQEFEFAAYSRFGHPHWQYDFFPGDSGYVTVNVIEQQPEFPDGISTDEDGNLIIDSTFLGTHPQANGQNWLEITVAGTILRTGGKGGAQYNTSGQVKNGNASIMIFRDALADGIVLIEVQSTDVNGAPCVIPFSFYLFVEDGVAVGAVLPCDICGDFFCDCE